MKAIKACLFLMLYTAAMLRPLHPFIEYYANQDFFANVLCINKDKPELACKGKCILMQKLKNANPESATPSNPNTPPTKIDFKDYPIGFISFLNLQDSIPSDFSIKMSELLNFYFLEVKPDIFHPPIHLFHLSAT